MEEISIDPNFFLDEIHHVSKMILQEFLYSFLKKYIC